MAWREELFWAAWPLVLSWRKEHARLSRLWSRGEQFASRRRLAFLGLAFSTWSAQIPWGQRTLPLYRSLRPSWGIPVFRGWELLRPPRGATESFFVTPPAHWELLAWPDQLLELAYVGNDELGVLARIRL
jgi:hypothetical protein